MRPLDAATLAGVDAAFASMAAEAAAILEGATVGGRLELARHVDVRYTGQSYELTIALPDADGLDAAGRLDALIGAFAREHERTYGHASLTDPISVVNLRLTAGIRGRSQPAPGRMGAAAPAAVASRQAWFGRDDGPRTVPVIGRTDLDATPRSGPLLVDEYDATTLVPPRAAARLDEHGNIVIATQEAR